MAFVKPRCQFQKLWKHYHRMIRCGHEPGLHQNLKYSMLAFHKAYRKRFIANIDRRHYWRQFSEHVPTLRKMGYVNAAKRELEFCRGRRLTYLR